MAYLLSGLVALVVALLIARGFTSANPATMARQLRFLGGVLLMAIAAVLALRGRIDFALLLGFAGWGLLMGRGVLPWGSGGWGGSTPSPNQGSRVATDHLEMELDHTSGAIRGTILKGRFAGQDIETLSPAELVLIWQDYSFADPSSAQILEAYLDRRHPTWRDDLERQAEGEEGEDAYRSEPRGQRSAAPRSGAMTRAEAFEILGLQEGASDDAIRSAHRELMKKLHPDRGGSNYLASKINAAKALLVGD
jgi:hypothetical protein